MRCLLCNAKTDDLYDAWIYPQDQFGLVCITCLRSDDAAPAIRCARCEDMIIEDNAMFSDNAVAGQEDFIEAPLCDPCFGEVHIFEPVLRLRTAAASKPPDGYEMDA